MNRIRFVLLEVVVVATILLVTAINLRPEALFDNKSQFLLMAVVVVILGLYPLVFFARNTRKLRALRDPALRRDIHGIPDTTRYVLNQWSRPYVLRGMAVWVAFFLLCAALLTLDAVRSGGIWGSNRARFVFYLKVSQYPALLCLLGFGVIARAAVRNRWSIFSTPWPWIVLAYAALPLGVFHRDLPFYTNPGLVTGIYVALFSVWLVLLACAGACFWQARRSVFQADVS